MKIGIDIGGSHVGIGVVDDKGNLVEKIETDISSETTQNLKQYIEKYMQEKVKQYLKKYPSIEVIGVASPGTPQGGTVTALWNLGIEELKVEESLKKVCSLPIIVRNDAKAAAIAEKKFGSLKPYQDAIFLCPGTGIGGATFIDGKLLTPKRYPGMEIGHMIIEKDGKQCACGKKGCFETYASMKQFKKRVIEVLDFPKEIEAKKLLAILKEHQQEEKLQQLILEYLEYLIIGLSNLIDIFEPEAICFGGSFVYFKDILFDRLVTIFEERRYVFNKETLPVLTLATLGNDAGMIGAGERDF